MVSLNTYIYRGNIIESHHRAICLIKDTSNKTILSTNNDCDYIYPRSAIKIFQALPFVHSKAHIIFNLEKESVALACSSHAGEPMHLRVLNKWLKKIDILENQLLCGSHNPLDEKSSNQLLLNGKIPTQLHNNCAGKHLGMISGCIANKFDIDKYTNFNHPYQKLIREVLENFMQSKIQNNFYAIDGCNAPQYAFTLANIASSMTNLIIEKNAKSTYSSSINTIIKSINKFPLLIGGHNSFDSDIIKITKGKIFCKIGAEGVLLFADFKNKIGGVIKIMDGNNRAVPSIAMQIFIKLKLLTREEIKKLSYWKLQPLLNHAKKNTGKIAAQIKYNDMP